MKYPNLFSRFLTVLLLLIGGVLSGCTLPWQYTITFNTQGGTPVESLIVNPNDIVEAPVEPTKEGHTFIGWSTAIDDEDQLFEFNNSINASIELFAIWQVNHYTLRFEDTHGNHLRTVTSAYGSRVTTPYISVPLGYHVGAWVDGETVVDVTTMPAGNHTLHPRITIQQFYAPILSIELAVPLHWVGLDTYEQAAISLIDSEGNIALDAVDAEFKGRGNGSWGYDQKSYRIKFDKKQGLFGETPSKHWVIVAGANDFTSVRAYTAFNLANQLFDGIEYTTSTQLLDVYVNEEYRGVYTLMEHVRVGEDRVDIESEYGVIDTGYLIEYDAYASGTYGIDHFWVPGLRYAFTMKSPDPEEYMEEVDEQTYRDQVEFIQAYMTSVMRAIYDRQWTTLSSLVDMDSMIDMYLLHELYKNTDTGWSSFFMYKKPGGKLYFGPPWDFDYTAGISRGDASPEGLYVGGSSAWLTDFTSSEIYTWLMKQSYFVEQVKERYIELYPQIKTAVPVIFNEVDQYTRSFGRDAIRWSWHSNYRNEQNYVENWLLDRNEWLYEWASDE